MDAGVQQWASCNTGGGHVTGSDIAQCGATDRVTTGCDHAAHTLGSNTDEGAGDRCTRARSINGSDGIVLNRRGIGRSNQDADH